MISKKTYIPAKPRNRKLVNPAGPSMSSIVQETGTSGIKQRVDAIEQKVNNTKVGVSNLLRNTGFLGDFQSLTVDALTAVTEGTPVSTNPLVHWVHNGTEVIDAPSRSGKGVKIGSIQQTVVLAQGSHILSFWAKGGSLSASLVESISVSIGSEYKKYSFGITVGQAGSYTLSLSGDVSIYEIMLSEGNTEASYSYSDDDDHKVISQLQAINTITSAIKDGDTQILGGLLLTSMIQLGRYKDGILSKVNAGINGIWNSDDDPSVWSGGTFEQAIRTVQKIKTNPGYNPTDAEWADMAKIVMTHGGDGFFRGFIYALGGYFRGKIESNSGGNRFVIDPDERAFKAVGSDGKVRFSIKYYEVAQTVSSYLEMYAYDANGNVTIETKLRPDGLTIQTYGGLTASRAEFILDSFSLLQYTTDPFAINMEVSAGYNSIGNFTEFKITGLPTNSASVSAGMMYNDGGTLKIKQ